MSHESSSSRVALVDCNNFYCSCERLFRPDWARKPVVVLSNNDGCVVARSQEVKDLGIPMGEPYFKCRLLLEKAGAVVASSNYELYGDISARVMQVLQSYGEIEIYSIDEAWLDLSWLDGARVSEVGRQICREVKRLTGIPVSMGIAPTKVLAKLSSRIVKKRQVPGGVFDLGSAGSLEGILEAFEVEDLWGIASRLGKRMRALGLRTALDLRDADPGLVRKSFGVVGARMQLELRGLPSIGREDAPKRKSIHVSRTFGAAVTNRDEVAQAVISHASRAAEKLRLQGSVASEIRVFLSTDRFDANASQYSGGAAATFAVATSSTLSLVAAARRCFEQAFRAGYRYRKAGVLLEGIQDGTIKQDDLFESGDDSRSEALMEAVDQVNRRFGRGALVVGSAVSGQNASWRMVRSRCSPAYTTRWSELRTVR